MTVAAACLFTFDMPWHERQQAAITIADRMVSSPTTEAEPRHAKTCYLSDNIHILVTSSDYSIQSKAILDLQRQIAAAPHLNVHDVAERYHLALTRQRSQLAESRFLFPYKLTMADITTGKHNLDPACAARLMDDIEKMEASGEAGLVVGWDEHQAHIYTVDYLGWHLDSDVGYGAVGSGAPRAYDEFFRLSYSKGSPYQTALFTAYLAKKEAEKTPGVGPATDIHLMLKSGSKHLGLDVVRSLDEVLGLYTAGVSAMRTQALSELKKRIA